MAIVTINLDPKSATFGSSNVPTIVNIIGASGGPTFGYGFIDSARNDIYFSRMMPVFGASNVNILVRPMWYSVAGSVVGNVVWGARLYACSSGDAVSVEAKAFGAAATVTSLVNGTAKGPKADVITVTGLDSLTSSDYMLLNLYRDGAAGGDDMVGTAVLMGVQLQFSDL